MNILLIDNGTIHLAELKRLLHGHTIKTQKFDQPTLADNLEGIDLIILSGGSQLPVMGNESKYKQEIELIKNCPLPILGICLGFELIGFVFGAELKDMKNKEKGIIDIQTMPTANLFKNLPNFSVFESHRWVINKLPHDLIELARSKDGIEVIKHRTRPLYGFQFHPEMLTEKTCGDEIFFNLLNDLKRGDQPE